MINKLVFFEVFCCGRGRSLLFVVSWGVSWGGLIRLVSVEPVDRWGVEMGLTGVLCFCFNMTTISTVLDPARCASKEIARWCPFDVGDLCQSKAYVVGACDYKMRLWGHENLSLEPLHLNVNTSRRREVQIEVVQQKFKLHFSIYLDTTQSSE